MSNRPKPSIESKIQIGLTGLFLLWLISVLGQRLLSLTPEGWYEVVESVIDYKWLLTLCLLSTSLFLFFFYLYLRKPKQSNENESATRKEPTRIAASREQQLEKLLHHLSGDEKELLGLHFEQDVKCMNHSIQSSTALGLCRSGILHRPEQLMSVRTYSREVSVTYCVSSWAWIYLKNNPQLLKNAPITQPPTSRPTKNKTKDETVAQMRKLQKLSFQEKGFLDYAFAQGSKRIDAIAHERAIAQAMVDQDILYHPEGHVLDFYMHDWVWELLQEHPNILKQEKPTK